MEYLFAVLIPVVAVVIVVVVAKRSKCSIIGTSTPGDSSEIINT